ncbi:MAG: helix-turn-helix transcriptional regulator [Desulfotomaculum sp.]|nr:helix-turn-helix transcriptional regulator [Desulfotomaculum sp.]
MNIAKRLKELRESKGFSVYKLSKLSEISSTYLHEIERGEKQPTVEKVSRICKALGITLAEFFADTQETEPLPPEIKRITELARQLHPYQLETFTELLEALVEKNKTKGN